MAHESGYIKNHLAGGTLLSRDAVNLKPHSPAAGVENLVTCCQQRTRRRKCIRTFSLGPLTSTFQLKSALGIIIVQEVTSHLFERLFPLDISAFLAHHDR